MRIGGLEFQWEIEDDTEFVDVSLNGEHVCSLDPAQCWELADWLTSGTLNHLCADEDARNAHSCATQVWHPKHEDYCPCGTDAVYCPSCEYELAKQIGYTGYGG